MRRTVDLQSTKYLETIVSCLFKCADLQNFELNLIKFKNKSLCTVDETYSELAIEKLFGDYSPLPTPSWKMVNLGTCRLGILDGVADPDIIDTWLAFELLR